MRTISWLFLDSQRYYARESRNAPSPLIRMHIRYIVLSKLKGNYAHKIIAQWHILRVYLLDMTNR